MTVFLFIFFLLLIAYGILIGYFRRAWNNLKEYQLFGIPDISVSIIVAVRNEAGNLEQLLGCLYGQNYPKDRYEVIVVDDHSSDNTEAVFTAFHTPELMKHYLRSEPGSHSKKSAITRGVDQAQGKVIITTDADCSMGSAWISHIAACFTDADTKLIAAPVFMQGPKTFLGIFQSLDFLALQGITGAAVDKRFLSMCNGANLAYTKEVFQEVGGYEGIDTIASGDDMLLMHKIALNYPLQIRYLKSREAVVTTSTETSWKAFFNQRIRWASKGVHYKDKKIVYVLLLTYLFNFCFIIMAVASLLYIKWSMFLLLFLAAKILIEFPFVNAVAIFFRQRALMWYFPLMQPFHIIYTIIAGWLGRFGSYKWKSRVVKNN